MKETRDGFWKSSCYVCLIGIVCLGLMGLVGACSSDSSNPTDSESNGPDNFCSYADVFADGFMPDVTTFAEGKTFIMYNGSNTDNKNWIYYFADSIKAKQQQYTTGQNINVDANDNGNIIEVHQGWNNWHGLHYNLGTITWPNILWYYNPIEYAAGKNPSITINNNRAVVGVHSTYNTSPIKLQYWVAQVSADGQNIDGGKHISYQKGYNPSVSINDSGTVVLTYSYGDMYTPNVYYNLGTVNTSSKSIDWWNPDPIKTTYPGNSSSVAISNDGSVFLLFIPMGEREIYYLRGQINKKTKKIDFLDDGKCNCEDCNSGADNGNVDVLLQDSAANAFGFSTSFKHGGLATVFLGDD